MFITKKKLDELLKEREDMVYRKLMEERARESQRAYIDRELEDMRRMLFRMNEQLNAAKVAGYTEDTKTCVPRPY